MPVHAMIRTAVIGDARSIHRLITKHAAEGRLLPRTLGDVTEHADRFVIASSRGRVAGCAELAPLGSAVAEVRSLVVGARHRGAGLGRRLVDELRRRAVRNGFDQLCAFVHDADYFARLGFSVVSPARIPEKIETDCHRCALFGHCGQFAMLMELAPMVRLKPDITHHRTRHSVHHAVIRYPLSDTAEPSRT